VLQKINIKRILAEHAKWLNGEINGKRADFSGMDLSELDMSGLFLKKALFVHTNLTKTVLRGSELAECVFDEAILDYADVRLGKLAGATFIKARAHHSNFFGAKLENTDWQDADVINSNFSASLLKKANFSGALLSGTKFTKANAIGATFDEADKYNANFNGMILTDVCVNKPTGVESRNLGCFYSPTRCSCSFSSDIEEFVALAI